AQRGDSCRPRPARRTHPRARGRSRLRPGARGRGRRVSPKRGERAAPPPVGDEYDLRFASGDAADDDRNAPGDLRRAFDRIRSAPRAPRAWGTLGGTTLKGRALEQWLFEVAGGGRIRYLLDDANRTAWIRASQGDGLTTPATIRPCRTILPSTRSR